MKVYKYRTALCPYTYSLFEKSEIYFASVDSLNDPFEYAFEFTKNADLPTKVRRWSDLGDSYYQKIAQAGKDEDKLEVIKGFEESLPNPSSSYFWKDSPSVFCTSKRWNSPAMWHHYADGHRGICIEFETDAEFMFRNPYGVNYKSKPTSFDLYTGAPKDLFTTKFKDWAYENEVRFFNIKGPQKISNNAITSILLGISCTDSREAIRRILDIARVNFPNAKIERLFRSRNQYGFSREPLKGYF